MSVARLSLPSVVSALAANFMPGPVQFPSAYLVRVLERDKAVRQTSGTTCIIGNRVPARGHRWIIHLLKRGSILLSLLIAGGVQPRLCRPKRHRFLTREAEFGAIPPHPVKYHADAPGQGNGCALHAAELGQTLRPGFQPVRPRAV